MNNHLFECMLGIHKYEIPDKYNYILICKYCKRYGYYKNDFGYEIWAEYDNKGNRIHCKDNKGHEIWAEHDNKGNEIYCKNNEGYEIWRDNNGYWTSIKPKNWKYEKFIIKEEKNEQASNLL